MATRTPRISVRVNTDRLDKLTADLPGKVKAIVDETALSIQFRAKQIAPKDTTSLSESIYHNNGDESDYALRTAIARGVNRDVIILEEISPDFVLSLSGGDAEYTQVIGVAAGHGIFLEYGTRFMAPQPYMTPAVEPERDAFVTRMSTIADDYD